MPNKFHNLKPFKPIGSQPLARSPLSLRVPPKLDEAVRSVPDKTDWLRGLIAAGARERGIYQGEEA